jgi:hypothetical protein
LTNKDIEEHLRGNVFLATYCINLQNVSKFIVFEILDEDKYKLQITLNSLNIRAYYELNSYNAVFAWIFLQDELPTKIVFNFAQFILKKANINAKIYPNKEFATKESLGNSLELPLTFKIKRQKQNSFY